MNINKDRVMSIDEAIIFLDYYNEWRRGGDGEMPNVTLIGIAIDTVIEYHTNFPEFNPN